MHFKTSGCHRMNEPHNYFRDVQIPRRATGRESVKQWFDRLEDEILPQSNRARVLEHNPSVGTIREFLVEEVLKQLLPASTVYGSGHVISADGGQSRQQDIILYDPRFPSFAFKNGQGLYPIEGVLATIEIKSELTTKELRKALDGSLSVLQLPTTVIQDDLVSVLASAGTNEAGKAAISEQFFWDSKPRTYIFALRGLGSADSLAVAMNGWLRSAGFSGTVSRPLLPAVVVSGGAIATAWGDPVMIRDPQPVDKGVEAHLNVTTPFAICWESARRFGWLATHLLYTFQRRWLHGVRSDAIRRSLDSYFSFAEYFEEATREKHFIILGRTVEGEPGKDHVQ